VDNPLKIDSRPADAAHRDPGHEDFAT